MLTTAESLLIDLICAASIKHADAIASCDIAKRPPPTTCAPGNDPAGNDSPDSPDSPDTT
jgi:hypothetical protein